MNEPLCPLCRCYLPIMEPIQREIIVNCQMHLVAKYALLSLYFNNSITAVSFYSHLDHIISSISSEVAVWSLILISLNPISLRLNRFHKLAFSCECQRSKVWRVVAPSEGELVTKHVEIIPESIEIVYELYIYAMSNMQTDLSYESGMISMTMSHL